MKPHQELRVAMFIRDMTGREMAAKIGMEVHTFSHAMTARRPWKITEMYKILDVLGEPHTELSKYFPPDGRKQQVDVGERK